MTTTTINGAFLRLSRRAETNERSKLVATFVDVGPLFTLLSSSDHQVMYGRRGTGKTHVLSYLAETVKTGGDASIYVDMRTVGSSGGIYADESLPLAERATRLLSDTLSAVHDYMTEYMIERAVELDLSRTGPLLDRLAEAITQVRVVGAVQTQETTTESHEAQGARSAGLSVGVVPPNVKIDMETTGSDKHSRQTQRSHAESGQKEHWLHFGSVGNALTELTSAMAGQRIWLLLDEWSHVPLDLQPYLADLLRRSVLPVKGITVKIAAIEQRSRFQLPIERSGYIGLELGADIAADVNLDDFMVFDNDAERAMRFFQELVYKHVKAVADTNENDFPNSSDHLIQLAFTQQNVFNEFVRAAEGVPRDAINILSLAAQKAMERRIAMDHVRSAARDWYQRDKAAAVRANPEAQNFLHWIIDKVIENRRARAFLLRSDVSHPLIDHLFDARVLHVLKRNISAHDQPGVRYDVYKLDYGCYVDLINTTRAPQGLLPLDDPDAPNETRYTDVPPDDYRSIRRAILDLDAFEQDRVTRHDNLHP